MLTVTEMFSRAPQTLIFSAIFAFVGCASNKPTTRVEIVSLPPPNHSPPVPPTECDHVENVIADALGKTDALEGATELEALRATVTTPRLAQKIDGLARTEHLVALVTSFGALDRAAGNAEPSSNDHATYVVTHQRELARHAALAECSDDGSRDQSAAWQADMIKRFTGIATKLAPCVADELDAHPDVAEKDFTLNIKVHIAPDGHVVLAGPDEPYPLPGSEDHPFSSELDYCAMKVVEREMFAPPVGNAIVTIPFMHAAKVVGPP